MLLMLLLRVAAAVPLFSVSEVGKLKLPIAIATIPEPPVGGVVAKLSAAPRPVFAVGVALAQTDALPPQPPIPYSTDVPVIDEITPAPAVNPEPFPPAPPPAPALTPEPVPPVNKLPPLLEPIRLL